LSARSATTRMRSGFATEVPPNFWTIKAKAAGAYRPDPVESMPRVPRRFPA
jgi:hypothetical protein